MWCRDKSSLGLTSWGQQKKDLELKGQYGGVLSWGKVAASICMPVTHAFIGSGCSWVRRVGHTKFWLAKGSSPKQTHLCPIEAAITRRSWGMCGSSWQRGSGWAPQHLPLTGFWPCSNITMNHVTGEGIRVVKLSDQEKLLAWVQCIYSTGQGAGRGSVVISSL